MFYLESEHADFAKDRRYFRFETFSSITHKNLVIDERNNCVSGLEKVS